MTEAARSRTAIGSLTARQAHSSAGGRRGPAGTSRFGPRARSRLVASWLVSPTAAPSTVAPAAPVAGWSDTARIGPRGEALCSVPDAAQHLPLHHKAAR